MMHTKRLSRKYVTYKHVPRPTEPKKTSLIINFDGKLITIILCVMAIMVLDAVTTRAALTSGLFYEGNTFMKTFADNIWALMSIKILYLILIIAGYYYFKGYEKITIIPFFACYAFHLAAVSNNVYQMLTL